MKKVIAASGDFSIFHLLMIVSNVFMRNGTYPLMFIGRVYNSMRNGTYPLMFIGRVYNSFLNINVVHPYNNMDTATAWKKFWVFLLDRSDFYMISDIYCMIFQVMYTLAMTLKCI